MTGAVHAIIGAAVGSLFKERSSACAAGVVSHIVADALPHDDFHPVIEAPLLAAAMLGIAKWRGLDSPEFWGAVGGAAPDVEHGLMVAGVITPEQEVFPTHIDDGAFHGKPGNERLSQLLISAASIACILISDELKKGQSGE